MSAPGLGRMLEQLNLTPFSGCGMRPAATILGGIH